MAKADRLARLDERRLELEAEYRSTLIVALERTAAGTWGLFGHVPNDRHAREKAAPDVAQLNDLAEAIDEARERLALEPFALHAEFRAAQGKPRSPSAVGEPKQARAWLDRIAAEGADNG
jgi:hypothetical protein